MQNFGNLGNFGTTSSTPVQRTNPTTSFANFGFNVPFAPMNPIPNLNNYKLDMNMEVAQTIPKPKLKAILNNNERGYYSSLLSQADPVNANSVQGKEAVTFFKRSGLSIYVLKKIWLLASSNNESLDREEFYVALKLIAFSQNNIEVSAESLAKNIPTALQKFSSLVPEKKEEKVDDTQPNNNLLNADLNNMTIPNENIKNPQSQAKQTTLNLNNFSNPTPLNLMTSNTTTNNMSLMQGPTSNSPASQTESNKRLTDTDSKMNLEKLHKYESYFKALDTQQSGVIGGAEAREVFLKSGLPTQQLFQIWKLVDTKKEGNLSKGEFMVALHLIMLTRQGFILPQELPRPLMEIINEYQAPMGGTLLEKAPDKSNQDLINVGEMKFDDKCNIIY